MKTKEENISRSSGDSNSFEANKIIKFAICIFLVVTTFAVYGQVQDHEFLLNYDDNKYVTESRNVQAGLTSESVKWAFTTSHFSMWHPMTWLSHMLDYQFYGLNPKGHHLTNLLFHIANTLLLFLVLLRMTGALWQSCFVAALFAFHPLNVESVAWVAERKNVLSTFFWLLTMWAYAHYVEKPGVKRYGLVALFFALGLIPHTPEITITLGTIEICTGKRPQRDYRRIYRQEIRHLEPCPGKNPLISTYSGFKHHDFYSSKKRWRITCHGGKFAVSTPYLRNGFIPGVCEKDPMARGTGGVLSSSRKCFGCMERNIVRHGIGGHFSCNNQIYQEGALSCFWMVLVFGNLGASNPDCADRPTWYGRPVCLYTPYRNIHHCCVGIARAYGKVALSGQVFDTPCRNIFPNINGNDLEPSESLEKQYYHF